MPRIWARSAASIRHSACRWQYLHAVGCSCLASLRVDFLVSNKGSSLDAYELTDTIFLRNSTRL